jgi:spore germination cell wall hydrolase CwlJ-like protein
MKNFIAAILLALATTFGANAREPSIQIFTQEEYPEHYCLALNIYFEARGSTLADRAAVANVVINRVNDRRYPDTICGVVKQGVQDSAGNMVRNQCQFSWYCDGKADVPTDTDMWVESQMLAWYMIEDSKYLGLAEGATHYHATYVSPSWRRDLQLVGRIGEHIFYRWEN